MFSQGTKVWFFLLAISLSLLIVGEHFGGRLGLLIGLLCAVALNGLVFYFGENRILSALDARHLLGRDPWGLREKVEALCARLEIRPPQLYLIPSPTATAFSVAIVGREPSLCVSRGLLEKLDDAEVEAVLAQQLCNLDRLDSFGVGVAGVLANTFVGIGQVLDRLWPANFFLGRRQKPFLSLVSPIGWLIVRAVVRRSVFSENDRAAADLIGSRARLGEVLWKLEGFAQTRPLEIPPCTGHLFIVNPEGFRQKNFFLRAHPPLAERLRILIGTPTV